MSVLDIACPDLGGFSDVLVIDVLVKPGDEIALEAPLLTLETDKATMDVPATVAGRVTEVLVARGGRVSISSLNWLAIRSRIDRRCRSPSARSTVSLVVESCSMTIVGSSAIIRCSTSEIRCSSPRFFGVIATPCIGTGNSSGRMWMWSSSCESCSTQSNSISSTLATAAMSPGTALSTSTFLPPCSMNRWPTLNGLRPSPTKSCVSLVTVP